MTAQMSDRFSHDGIDFCIAGISADTLFDPETLGLHPVMASTMCWRGYVLVCALSGRQLVAKDLYVNLKTPAPTIHSMTPARVEFDRTEFLAAFTCNHAYRNLNLPLAYTGGILIADGFIRELYVHMGFHPAWKYERVRELVFTDGIMEQDRDLSATMAEFRAKIPKKGEATVGSADPPSPEAIKQWIARTFDQSYE